MSDLVLHLNIDELAGEIEGALGELQAKLDQVVQSLSVQAHAHVIEEAQQKLHSRRQVFTDALKLEQVDKHTWSVVVPKEVLWIEDGTHSRDMLPDLLASSKAKTGKNGNRYIVIPFQHSKEPSQQTTFQKTLLSMIKTELKTRKIGYKKIERNQDGTPKLGRLHSFNIDSPQPVQSHHSSPLLHGVSIYQSMNKGRGGKISVSRDILTFRIASSSQAGSGKWSHPGNEPMNFLDSAHEWIQNIWESEIKPQLIKEFG